MIVLPIYDMLLLPGVNFYFRKDVLSSMPVKEFSDGEDVLFLVQNVDKKKSELLPEDFYEKGLIGRIENIDDEGNVSIRVTDRVIISDIEKDGDVFTASGSVCPTVEDLPDEERRERYKETKESLIQFVQHFQWGVVARSFIQHWHTLSEMICAVSVYMNLTPEDKYEILATDSMRERTDLIQNSIYEFIEMVKVSGEAEHAQRETHEKAYRETALKKQISILQQELDEMHPENISDVRKFEKKIAEAGMNPEAEAEAKKVLNRMKQEGKDSHEYGMLYDYLDFVTTLSWKKAEPEPIDLTEAQDILDEDHYGLKKVKERIIQQIAVMALKKKQSGSILLFVGAPGTGKTSIGQSIAKALHRMLYDYLDFVTTLSWKKAEPEPIDLTEAQDILDEDHYGLKKVKERIIQQIAVMALKKKQSGSILLFVGAPGTGKTSIGQSIAKALHREYVRISLGGIRDEAEIRGHRRTYIGAMPGRIMEGVKRSGASNPVIVLDEVDKLASEYHGDPASALLEVLDPEQNFSFTDHYMNVPYDLSDVLFVCTANTIDTIPEPLLNRMETIQFPGYTAVEKFQIAKRHLLPKAMESMGIKKSSLKVTDDAIRMMISEYTAESGVRGLKKQMDVLCRHAAVKLVRGDQKSITVSEKRVPEFLDGRGIRHDKRLESALPGVVTGLAWTQAGGDILFIETSVTEGKGKLSITGQLGDVMKESIQIALTLTRSMFPEETAGWDERNIHVHVPAGAVPKDGPSAGITITTALVSLAMQRPVPTDIAMTGEISLRGGVMPIGGLPEKLMAAQRAGLKRIFIPYDNIEDLEDVVEEVKSELEIIPVKRVGEVLQAAGLTGADAGSEAAVA
ncbi:MAG: endopeptidase La [Clostridiales bacterium]|nr:endopeptidase La [Clostridiales bacterium]